MQHVSPSLVFLNESYNIMHLLLFAFLAKTPDYGDKQTVASEDLADDPWCQLAPYACVAIFAWLAAIGMYHTYGFLSTCIQHRACVNVGNTSKIVKTILDKLRITLAEETYLYQSNAPRYVGWALPGPDMLFDHCRPYCKQKLYIAKNILLPGDKVHNKYSQTQKDYSHWNVMHESTIAAIHSATLMTRLKAQGLSTTDINVDEWDNNPVKLIEQVLPYAPASFDEINVFFKHLQSRSIFQAEPFTHTAFTAIPCAMHVHMGLASFRASTSNSDESQPPTFPLATLQHLVYLLTQYHHTNSSFFPASRRPGGATALSKLKPNLDKFLLEPEYIDLPLLTDANFNADGILCIVLPPLGPELAEVEYHVQMLKLAKQKIPALDMTIEKLACLMCSEMNPKDKGYGVSWTYLARQPGEGPRTILSSRSSKNLWTAMR